MQRGGEDGKGILLHLNLRLAGCVSAPRTAASSSQAPSYFKSSGVLTSRAHKYNLIEKSVSHRPLTGDTQTTGRLSSVSTIDLLFQDQRTSLSLPLMLFFVIFMNHNLCPLSANVPG